VAQPSQEPARNQSADPGLLTPEAIQLIDGQYADRGRNYHQAKQTPCYFIFRHCMLGINNT
jgi:hypothetical protein